MNTSHLERRNVQCVGDSEPLSVVVGEKGQRKRSPRHRCVERLVGICGTVQVRRQGDPELIV